MKKETKTKPVYETKRVQVDTKSVDVYVSDDGKEFKTEKECIKHEEKVKEEAIRLSKINKAKDQFIEATELGSELIRLCFEGYNSITDEMIVIWKATNDTDKKLDAFYYLQAKGFNKNSNMLNGYEEGEHVAIASWIEDYHSDYPSYECRSVSIKLIYKKLDSIKQSISNLIK